MYFTLCTGNIEGVKDPNNILTPEEDIESKLFDKILLHTDKNIKEITDTFNTLGEKLDFKFDFLDKYSDNESLNYNYVQHLLSIPNTKDILRRIIRNSYWKTSQNGLITVDDIIFNNKTTITEDEHNKILEGDCKYISSDRSLTLVYRVFMVPSVIEYVKLFCCVMNHVNPELNLKIVKQNYPVAPFTIGHGLYKYTGEY